MLALGSSKFFSSIFHSICIWVKLYQQKLFSEILDRSWNRPNFSWQHGEIRRNACSPVQLFQWKSNKDVQCFVTLYDVTRNITFYLSKLHKSLSDPLKHASAEKRRKPRLTDGHTERLCEIFCTWYWNYGSRSCFGSFEHVKSKSLQPNQERVHSQFGSREMFRCFETSSATSMPAW